MKALTHGLVLALSLAATSAHAVWNPSWDRPIKQATMIITEASGTLADVKDASIVLTKRDLTNFRTLTITLDGETLVLPVIAYQQNRCGGSRIEAKLHIPGFIPETFSLSLLEQTHRIDTRCLPRGPIPQPAVEPTWTATFTYEQQNVSRGELQLQGTPEHVITIQ